METSTMDELHSMAALPKPSRLYDDRRSSSSSSSSSSSVGVAVAALPSSVSRRPSTASGSRRTQCNLDRFLESTCPGLRPQYLPKSCQWEACQKKQPLQGDVEPLPYFVLGDLWDSFNEWSAYGAGVPITLSGKQTVVQYYVPYMSALQLYTPLGRRPSLGFRGGCRGDESDSSDGEYREAGVEACLDHYCDRVPNCWNWKCDCGRTLEAGGDTCCECCRSRESEKHTVYKAGTDERREWDDRREWCTDLLFQYFEHSPPHARVPLADKINHLGKDFPELRTLRSVDLLPASWMSVAWYPIYRIPMGPTLCDLQACFLTYHCLSTSLQDGAPSGIVEPSQSPLNCHISLSCEGNEPQVNLQAFGLAHYKLRGSIWTSTGNQERRHAASLFKCAETWLRCLSVDHPDFEFFRTHY